MILQSENIIIQAVGHEIRRTILRLLQMRPYSYSELMRVLNIQSSGKLNYHLNQITGLIQKREKHNDYELTPLGEKMLIFLDVLRANLTTADTPFLCEAYVSQSRKGNESCKIGQDYLKAAIETIKLIHRLIAYLEKQDKAFELVNFLSQIEVKASTKILSMKESVHTNPENVLPPQPNSQNIWQAIFDITSHALTHVLNNQKGIEALLSSWNEQAIVLQTHLVLRQDRVESPIILDEFISLDELI